MSEPPITPAEPQLYLQVQTSDDLIVSYSTVPIVEPQAGCYLAEVPATELTTLEQPGNKYLETDGTIRVVPPPPPPIQPSATVTVSSTAHTTDDTPTEIYRLTAATNHFYTATLTFMGTGAAFAVYEASRRYVWKRATAGALLVGEAPITDIPESATADWDVRIRMDGNDAVIEVIGERLSGADWLVLGEVAVFAPGGLA